MIQGLEAAIVDKTILLIDKVLMNGLFYIINIVIAEFINSSRILYIEIKAASSSMYNDVDI